MDSIQRLDWRKWQKLELNERGKDGSSSSREMGDEWIEWKMNVGIRTVARLDPGLDENSCHNSLVNKREKESETSREQEEKRKK